MLPCTISADKWGPAFRLGRALIASQAEAAVESTATFSGIFVIFNLRAIFSSTGMGFLIYAFIPSLILTAGRLVEEKRVRVRESLKVMGLVDSAYILSNFISSILRMAIGTGLIAFCLAIFQVITPSDIPAVFGISILFAFSLISFAQIMPALFSASIWSNVMCIILLSGGAALSSFSTGWGEGAQYFCCLLSPVAFYYGVLPYMSQGTVVLYVSTSGSILMLCISTAIHIIIGNYLYAINPGDFGVPKHPLFFIRWIWAKNDGPRTLPQEGKVQADDTAKETYRIVLEDLVKYYGDQRHTPSVNHLSLSIKRGEIFALLGHNGAGKTTTISILTGMITPTNYATATVSGMDISTEMDKIRSTIGLCPQFDVLFNDLTARQHLELFAEIKGMDRTCPKINSLMKELELPDDAQRSSTFSGGTKRRLSVGNALVGDASLIFLDEPSSGMDPLSRRKMWDLLRAERDAGKTIVLTTHFMEEADYLGERIAIMSRGRMFVCNTSQQLKDSFGVGYYLNLVKASAAKDNGEEEHQENHHDKKMRTKSKCDVEGALALVQKHVPLASLLHDSSGEATVLLPIESLSVFGVLLTDLEGHISKFGFHSYGVSMNTLEDVFVSISEKEEEAKDKEKGKAHRSTHDAAALLDMKRLATTGVETEDVFEDAMKVSYGRRVLSHMHTVFWRKWIMLRRTRRMQLMIVAFPLFFILIAFATIQPQQTKDTKSFQGQDLPDYQDFHAVHVNLRDTAQNDRVMVQFRRLYGVAPT